MSYEAVMREDRRLVYLRFLAEVPAYESNESILHSAIASFGHNVSRDVVRTDLAWLREQDLLTAREIADVMIVRATVRGVDVANGVAVVPGVKRPRPRA